MVIEVNKLNDVICLATGKTYEIVKETFVTAHPSCAPYPRFMPEYMIPIKKGGVVEYLYSVSEIIECLPEEIYLFKDKLNENQFKKLVLYHELRKNSFGYGKASEKYRFYICERYADIYPEFRIKGIQVSKKMKLEEIPLVR